MNNLVVITYKRPATEDDKKLYGIHSEYFWDSEAFHDDELASFFINRAKARYEDVNVFKCPFADYMNFVDNENAYVHFEQTGEHNLQAIEEDVEVGTDVQTEHIQLVLEMSRENESNSFDYTVDVDDVGQIVLTPKDEGTFFISIRRLAGYDSTEESITGNSKRFALSLDANMLADDDNFDWFLDIDEVGQAVITPDAENTSFLTVSVNDSLNLITESNEVDPIEAEEKSEFNVGDRVIADYNKVSKSGVLVDFVGEDPMDSYTGADSGSFEAWVVKFDDGSEGLYAPQYLTKDTSIHEEVATEINTSDIANKIMRGDIPLFSMDGEPDASYAHIEELDHQDKLYLFRYYYDPESNSAVSYHTKLVDEAVESSRPLKEEEENLPLWEVKFNTSAGIIKETFEAGDIDDAVMRAEQHIRMMSLKGENPAAWKSAEITSAISISG